MAKIYSFLDCIYSSENLQNHQKENHLPENIEGGKFLISKENGSYEWSNLDLWNLYGYGVEWDTRVSDPACTRIGNLQFHKTLPIQNKLKGCIAQKSKIIYWLKEDDWRFKKDPIENIDILTITSNKTSGESTPGWIFVADGANIQTSITPEMNVEVYCKIFSYDGLEEILKIQQIVSNNIYTDTPYIIDPNRVTKLEIGSRRDGYDGTVRVYTPGFYIKSEEAGYKKRVWITEEKFDDSAEYQPPCLVDAYKSTVLNTVPENMGYLSTLPVNSAISVVNSNSYCRGGNNSPNYDSYEDKFRSTLGKSRIGISLATSRSNARLAGSEVLSYNQYKNIFYWLYVIEYANFNCQLSFNDTLTEDGYRQGGLGNGVSGFKNSGYYNPNSPITINGYTDELGNISGIKQLVIPEFNYSIRNTSINNYAKGSGIQYTLNTNKITITSVTDPSIKALDGSSLQIFGDTIYTISGLEGGQQIIFKLGTETLLIVSEDGDYTINWPERSVGGNRCCIWLTLQQTPCNIVISSETVNYAEYTQTSQTFQVPRYRGFENNFGDAGMILDGIMSIKGDNSAQIYTCTDPSKYTSAYSDDYKLLYEIPTSITGSYIKEFHIGTNADIIPSEGRATSSTYKCDIVQSIPHENLCKICVGGEYNSHDTGLGYFSAVEGINTTHYVISFRTVNLI